MTVAEITDVPCLSCQRGYAGTHRCDAPDRCACDRYAQHKNPAVADQTAQRMSTNAECRIEDGVCSRHTRNNPTCAVHDGVALDQADRDAVAATLAAHTLLTGGMAVRGWQLFRCTCGWDTADQHAPHALHAAHLADVLAPLLAQARAEADTHSEVAESMTGLWHAERDRADRLEAMCDRLAEKIVDLEDESAARVQKAVAAALAPVERAMSDWSIEHAEGFAEDFAEAIREDGAWRLARDLRAAVAEGKEAGRG
jgi:hypothetical protein